MVCIFWNEKLEICVNEKSSCYKKCCHLTGDCKFYLDNIKIQQENKIDNILDFLQDKIQVDGVFNKDNMEIYFNLSEKEKQELIKIINEE